MMRLLDNGKFAAVYNEHVGPFLFNLRRGTVDYDAARETWVEDVYRLAKLPLEPKEPEEGKIRTTEERAVVIDIGAHIGTVAIWCALRGAFVHAYEASEENRNILAVHARRGGLNMHIWPEAVLDGGPATTAAIQGSGMVEVAHAPVGELTVDLATTIDRALTSPACPTAQVTLLKIDVEGAEWEILASAAAENADCLVDVRNIAIETHATDALTYGAAMAFLSRTHHVEAFGSYEDGGMIHARRY